MTGAGITVTQPDAKPSLVSFFEWFGELGFFCRRLLHGSFAPPYEMRELIRQLDSIGSLSFPLVALAGAATGLSCHWRLATVWSALARRHCSLRLSYSH